MRHMLLLGLLALTACGGSETQRAESQADDVPMGTPAEVAADAALANEAAAAEAADAAAGGNMSGEDVAAADNSAASNQ